MTTSPAALLPLVLAIICAAATAHAAAGEYADCLNACGGEPGAGNVENAGMQARSLKSESTARGRNASMRVGVGVGSDSTGGMVEARVQVGTQITVSGVSHPVSFDALRCFTLPKAATKALNTRRDVQVWWHGIAGGRSKASAGGSNGGSKGRGGGSGGNVAGTEGQAGAACKQVQFFANPACKGKALDEVLKPQYAGLRKFFNVPRWVGHGGTLGWVPSTKKISQWTSVSCKPGAFPASFRASS
ncbi:unnamed protein product [Closterium sp. Naga37s-1]|nr:unnamed protein product [Closterium sp. Naga37s-1]